MSHCVCVSNTGRSSHRTTYSCGLITPQFAKRTQLSRTRRGASTERHSSEDLTYGAIAASAGYSRRKLLGPSSGAPGDLGHLQPR